MEIELTADQMIDLIFEKKIAIGSYQIYSKASCLGILSKLDERLADRKILSPTEFEGRQKERISFRNRRRCLL
jgi:hypothetical protein